MTGVRKGRKGAFSMKQNKSRQKFHTTFIPWITGERLGENILLLSLLFLPTYQRRGDTLNLCGFLVVWTAEQGFFAQPREDWRIGSVRIHIFFDSSCRIASSIDMHPTRWMQDPVLLCSMHNITYPSLPGLFILLKDPSAHIVLENQAHSIVTSRHDPPPRLHKP